MSVYYRVTQVESFLTELYHGEPKACDLARFVGKMKEGVGEEGGARFSLDDIRSTMDQLKKEVRSTSTCRYAHPRPGRLQSVSRTYIQHILSGSLQS